MSEPTGPISRFTRRVLHLFIHGMVLTVTVELLEAFHVISDLAESGIRFVGWVILVGFFIRFTHRTFARGDVLIAAVLFSVFSSSSFALMMTEDIPVLHGMPVIGRHSPYHSLVKKIVFSGWSCSVVWMFVVILRGVEETEASLHENLKRLRQEMEERERAEEQSRQVQTELAHVNRVATLGEMVTGIAHELNQPLGAISFMAGAARKSDAEQPLPTPEKVQELMTAISDQACRAGDIIRRLRTMTRRCDENRDKVGINDLVNEVVALVQPEMRLNGIRIEMQLADSNPAVHVDRIQIQQVVLNLVRNAMDAVSTGAKQLTIRTAASDTRIPARPDAPGSVIIVVTDAGDGISEDDVSSVFKPFFTTKPNGMGMGLSISRSIVEAHEGWMSVLSAPGQGAEFTVTLPADDHEAQT